MLGAWFIFIFLLLIFLNLTRIYNPIQANNFFKIAGRLIYNNSFHLPNPNMLNFDYLFTFNISWDFALQKI